MSARSTWQEYCDQIQTRTWKAIPSSSIKSAKELRAQIFNCLNQASNEGILATKLHEIHRLLKLAESKQDGANVYEILGGQRNFKRRVDIPHFKRADGCWFDFSILIDQQARNVEIIAFDFEIRFPEKMPVRFLRFDLNPPGHGNDDRGMRFHLHPGSDDLMIHSLPMSPLEIVNLFCMACRSLISLGLSAISNVFLLACTHLDCGIDTELNSMLLGSCAYEEKNAQQAQIISGKPEERALNYVIKTEV